jgi:hypothetical protein
MELVNFMKLFSAEDQRGGAMYSHNQELKNCLDLPI